MADLGAARRVARAGLVGTDGQRWIQAFVGDVHAKDEFIGVADGTDINGRAFEVGTAVWASKGGNPLVVRNGGLQKEGSVSETGSSSGMFDAGVSDTFYSVRYKASATPTSDTRFALGLRLSATSTSGSADRGWSSGYTLRSLSDRLLLSKRDETTVHTSLADVAVWNPAANGHMAVEVHLSGPNIDVWLNGTKVISVTDSDYNGTHFAAGVWGHLTAASLSILDEIFVTELPSAPGAVDVDQIDTGDLAPIAAGATYPIHLRWGRIAAPTTVSPQRYALEIVRSDYVNGQTEIRNDGFVGNSNDEGYASFATGYYATADGTSTGAARAGMFHIRVRQENTGGVANWRTDSENVIVTAPTGASHDHGKGYVVASTTIASVQAPLAATGPDAAYGETMTLGYTLTHEPYGGVGTPTVVTIQNATTVHTGTPAFSGAVANTTDTLDNTYVAAEQGVGLRVTAAARTNSEPGLVLTGTAPAGYRFDGAHNEIMESSSTGTAFTEDAFTTDPLITVENHLQIGGTTYNATGKVDRRRPDQLGKVLFALANAKGAALAGITARETLTDNGGEVAAAIDRTETTDANGRSTLTSWDSQLPGGLWTDAVTITGPPEAVGLEFEPTEQWALTAVNSDLAPFVAAGPSGRPGDHVVPGEAFQVVIGCINASTGMNVAIDANTAEAIIVRLQHEGANQGFAEYLAADGTWQLLRANDIDAAYGHPVAETRPGSGVYVVTWTGVETAAWGVHDIALTGRFKVNGTPYISTSKEIVVGPHSSHANQYLIVTAGGPTELDDHWSAGMTFQAGLGLIDVETGATIEPDGYREIALVRLQNEGTNAGLGETLLADGITWASINANGGLAWHAVTETRPDSSTFVKNFTDTAGWGNFDVFVAARAKHGTRVYSNIAKEIGVGGKNEHSHHEVDPVAFALGGIIGMR